MSSPCPRRWEVRGGPSGSTVLHCCSSSAASAGAGGVGAFQLRSSAASGPARLEQGGGCAVAFGKQDSSAVVTLFSD